MWLHCQCLLLRVSQRLEADWWVTWIGVSKYVPSRSVMTDEWMVDERRDKCITKRTEGCPHGARPQLAVPYRGVEAHASRPGVLVDYQGVLVVVVDDLPLGVSVS